MRLVFKQEEVSRFLRVVCRPTEMKISLKLILGSLAAGLAVAEIARTG